MQFVGTEMSHDDNSVAACPPDRLVHGMSRRKDNDRKNEINDYMCVCACDPDAQERVSVERASVPNVHETDATAAWPSRGPRGSAPTRAGPNKLSILDHPSLLRSPG